MEQGSLEEKDMDQVSGVSVCGCTGFQTKTSFSENQVSSVPRACALDFNTAPSFCAL